MNSCVRSACARNSNFLLSANCNRLFKFRLYSVISQLILWGTIGLVFGPLVERMIAYAPRRAASDPASAPTASVA